jgi:hypothetical protein
MMSHEEEESQVPFSCHTDLKVCSLERLDPQIQQELLDANSLETIRTKFLSIRGGYTGTPLGILMGMICSRSGMVSKACACDLNGFSPLAIREMVIEQGALAMVALLELDKIISKG